MKKIVLFVLGLMMVVNAQAKKEVYTVFTASNNTLTYYYDEWDAHNGDYKERYDPDDSSNRFLEYYDQVWKGVVDESMKNAPLTSFDNMFGGYYGDEIESWYGFENMTEIVGLENLNTAIVTDMTRMFYMCGALETLDLSSFNTSNVLYMSEMFEDCVSLTSLDLSSFNTEQVTVMEGMFAYCEALEKLDLSSFNTSNVGTMEYMFYYCEIPELDITSFDMSNVAEIGSMFGRSKIKTIYCNDDWSQYSALTTMNPFSVASSLVGGCGTAYSSDHTDVSYAHPDMPGNPGYFTKKADYHHDNGWVYYDDGKRLNNFGPGDRAFHWAVMYPAKTLNYNTVNKIGLFTSAINTKPIEFYILSGGDKPENKYVVYGSICEPNSYAGMFTVDLEEPVEFDNTQNLWIVMSCNYPGYPAAICANTGDPNSRWYSMDGWTWGDLAETYSGGVKNDYSFMIRACFSYSEAVENVQHLDIHTQKILRDGQIYIQRGEKLFTLQGVEVR